MFLIYSLPFMEVAHSVTILTLLDDEAAEDTRPSKD